MALPTILIDSATGSDTAASGAGPSTALTGTSASTDGAGTLVTLDGSPDLTNVATDGSHVIYLADTTAGARNFGKITAKDAGAFTVTVANAFGLSLSGKSWAIGGKRASLGSTTSTKLIDNNSAAGDAMPGWILEFQSGHTETISATKTFRRSGDTTSGPIYTQGTAGAATRPIITFSNNGNGFALNGTNLVFRNFEIQNSNATKTASVAIHFSSAGGYALIRNVKVSHSTNKFWKAFTPYNPVRFEDCEIGYCANLGIDHANSTFLHVINCWIHDCGSHGIATNNGSMTSSIVIAGCLFTANTGNGVLEQDTGAYTASHQPLICIGNTFDANTSDGLKITGGTTARPLGSGVIDNNIFSNNGGYGINLSGASIADAVLQGLMTSMRGNCFYNNTSGATNPSSLPLTNEESSTANPTFTAGTTGGADYSIGTPLKALGYPTINIGTTSNTRSYVDPGASQRQESGGGVRLVNVNGGADQ